MFHLTREVRFAVNATPDDQLAGRPTNSYAGYPSLTGAGQFFAIRVTLRGTLQHKTSYLINIKQIDEVVRRDVVPLIQQRIRHSRFGGGAAVLKELFDRLGAAWGESTLEALKLDLTPFLHLEVHESEHPMVRLSQTFEFCASHRLHNPALSESENRDAFGKCNNPLGHGHNYVLEVALAGTPDENGILIPLPEFERIVSRTVIDRLDHRNLNLEVPEFRELNPSVENIAMVIFRMLQPQLSGARSRLQSVTVWETPKTSCSYSE